ncbi:MAG TPA: hypothetical protein VIY48_00990 [Candidatus Paceibacterota bacterium]
MEVSSAPQRARTSTRGEKASLCQKWMRWVSLTASDTVRAARFRLARFEAKRVYSYERRTGYAFLSVKRVGVYKIGA